MTTGTPVFSGGIGYLRILTIGIGALDLALSVDSLYLPYPLEHFFVITVIICLLISCLIVLARLVLGARADIWQKLDISFHILASMGLFMGAVCILTSVFRFSRSQSQTSLLRRIFAGIFGITNSITHVSIALMYNRTSV